MGRSARAIGIARSLGMYYGAPGRARRLRQHYGTLISPGSLAFDIGAHVGNRTRCWRQLGARVVAVEPQKDFSRILELLFGRDPHVTCVRAAVGATPGAASLHVSDRTPTVSTLSTNWIDRIGTSPGFDGVEWNRTETIGTLTLEQLIERFGRPDFVKIDVEGFESEVLAGLATPLPALSFEYLASAPDLALACVDRLLALGDYRFNWTTGERLRFAHARWQVPDAARRFLGNAGPGSGDVYARLGEAPS